MPEKDRTDAGRQVPDVAGGEGKYADAVVSLKSAVLFVVLTILNIAVFVFMVFENQMELIARNAELASKDKGITLKLRIADDRYVNIDVFSDGSGVGINMDDIGVWCESLDLSGNAVIEPYPDTDDEIDTPRLSRRVVRNIATKYQAVRHDDDPIVRRDERRIEYTDLLDVSGHACTFNVVADVKRPKNDEHNPGRKVGQ